MAERLPAVTTADRGTHFTADRIDTLLETLELMAAGETSLRLAFSAGHDELDAIAHGVNVLVGELGWASARVLEAERARLAELEAALAAVERAKSAKDVLLRNLSHEVRTPITAMLGLASLLASTDLSAEDRADLVRRIQVNGRAVLSLLGDLLDHARLDADRVVLFAEPVSVIELVREVLASVEFEVRLKALDVRIEARGEALGSLVTDRRRLRQILVNLVSNAVKFTNAGVIVVSVDVARAADRDLWTIEVTDTGIGIAHDRRERLFEPFEQAGSSITQKYGGTGLGLSLSRGLAERLGGTLVLLRSAPGEGSVFRLVLTDLPSTPDPESGLVGDAQVDAVRHAEGLRILLAEDHHDMRLALSRQLEKAGALIETASDGREAVAKALSGVFDLVLLDLWMPHVDGLEATRVLRARGIVVPIIILTAEPIPRYRAVALEAGCDACIYKVFTVEELMASVRSLRHS